MSDYLKMTFFGEVGRLEVISDTEDEAFITIWFNGKGEDAISERILVPKDTLKLRQILRLEMLAEEKS